VPVCIYNILNIPVAVATYLARPIGGLIDPLHVEEKSVKLRKFVLQRRHVGVLGQASM
jgi:hypothetical protein